LPRKEKSLPLKEKSLLLKRKVLPRKKNLLPRKEKSLPLKKKIPPRSLPAQIARLDRNTVLRYFEKQGTQGVWAKQLSAKTDDSNGTKKRISATKTCMALALQKF
jgi:hypothetical protein